MPQVIARGGANIRHLFENDDGDEAAVALQRRARRKLKLAANFAKYLAIALAEECDRSMADILTRQLPETARQSRQRAMTRRAE